jgi:hypothetical protein
METKVRSNACSRKLYFFDVIHLMNTVFTIFRIISIIKPRERKDRHLNALIKKRSCDLDIVIL